MVLKALKMCALVAMVVIRLGTITTTTTHMITPTTVMLTWTFSHPNRIDQSLRRGHCAPALEVPTLARAMACLVGSFDLGRDDPQKPFLVLSLGRTTNEFSLHHLLSCLLYLSLTISTIPNDHLFMNYAPFITFRSMYLFMCKYASEYHHPFIVHPH